MKLNLVLSGVLIGSGLMMICVDVFVKNQSPSWYGVTLMAAGFAAVIILNK